MLARYDAGLDAAFEQADADGDLAPLLETVCRGMRRIAPHVVSEIHDAAVATERR